MPNRRLLLLGKLPPPYMGPSIATQILLDSRLSESYDIIHVDTNVHESLDTLGGFSLRKVVANVSVYGRMFRALSRRRPDVVLVPISQATLGFLKDSILILLSRAFRKSTLLHLRGSNFQNWLATSSTVVRAYVETIVRSTQGVIVLGENLRYLFKDYFPDDRIFVVPNGADYSFEDSGRDASSRQDGPVQVLYVGNLQPSKGIQDVVQAVAQLNAIKDAFRLTVVGQWRDEATRAQCERLSAEGQLPIDFVGPAYGDDKLARLRTADVFVFAPREPEGHPWVIVEAMACGLPIVSTDQGAIVESVRHGVNGFIAESASPNDLARHLASLITDRELRSRMGYESRRLYSEHFTEDRMVEKLKAALDTLINAD